MDIVQVQVIDKSADNIQEIHAIKPDKEIGKISELCMVISVLDLWIKEELDAKYKKYVNTLLMSFFSAMYSRTN